MQIPRTINDVRVCRVMIQSNRYLGNLLKAMRYHLVYYNCIVLL